MNIRWIIAPVSGTVVLIAWGMIFWGLLAAPLGVFHALPNERGVTAELTDGGTATGTYFMPWPRGTAEEFAAFETQHRRGPFYRLSFVREGVDPSSLGKLLLGTIHYLSVSVLATVLLVIAGPNSFRQGLAIVFVGGLLGSDFITLGEPVWFHLPWDYSGGVLVYESVSWALLGLTVAAICPKRGSNGPR